MAFEALKKAFRAFKRAFKGYLGGI